MPDPGPRPPSSPIQVTPTYTSGGSGDCHVHHSADLVAVLVGLSNPELAGPLLTGLQNDIAGDAGTAGWLAASRTEPIAGAAVGMVGDDGTLEIGWWGRTDVQITTPYGFETHTGGEEPRTLTITGSTPVRIVPRAVHTTSGSNLERGTVMAAGCVVSLTPRPTTPDAMPEASSADVPIPTPAPEPADVPSDVPAPSPAAEPEPAVAAGPSPAPTPEPPTPTPSPTPSPSETPTPTPTPAPAPATEPADAAGADVATSRKVDLSAPPEQERAPLPVGTDDEMTTDEGVVLVRGLRCRNGHHNHPEARLCSLCGDAMQNVSIFVGRDGVLGELGERPPLGIVTLDDGQAYQIGKDLTLMGRSPSGAGPTTAVIEFPEDDTMSRAHLAIELEGWNVFIRDLGSSNGTGARFPDSDTYVRLEANRAYPLPTNTVLVFGRRWCTFTATSAAPA